MFDSQFTSDGASYIYTMYHSQECSGIDYGGVTITFSDTIEYIDLEIYTRTDCCRDRYNSVPQCRSPFLTQSFFVNFVVKKVFF